MNNIHMTCGDGVLWVLLWRFFFPFVFFDVSISDWMKSVAGVFPVIPAPVLDTQTCFDKLFFRLRHRGLQQI